MFRRKVFKRIATVVGAVVAVVVVVGVGVVVDGWDAFGSAAAGARKARMEASPQYRDGHFNNAQPMYNDPAALWAMFHFSPVASPRPEQPATPAPWTPPQAPPDSGLRVTWFGHASTLVEIDGVRVLTDPAFGERASPLDWIGPERFFPAVDVDALGVIDAVVISHDHHDHLQYSSVVKLRDKKMKWFVPLGVGAHLEYWGIAPEQITELDWWETARLESGGGGVDVACVPARHASGRHVLDQGATLWASWAFVGPAHRVFFSGDTGLHDAMTTIGERYGPFDLTMIEVGQYHPTWPDWHIGPEQAVVAHQRLRGRVFLPIHWGLYELAPHGWTEPAERVLAAAAAAGVAIVMPRPMAALDPTSTSTPAPAVAKWWPDEPWQTAAEVPVRSTVDGDPAHPMRLD